MSSNREWRWVNAITRNIEDVDIWWTVLDKVKNAYPTEWDANELLKPPEKRYLLSNADPALSEIAWGVSDNNFDAANKQAAFNVTHNNSPQEVRWIGGTRKRMYQFMITEFSYRHITGSTTDVYSNPPWRFMATKRIFKDLLSANSKWLWDEGVNHIGSPSTIQDGKNFANFSLGNNFAAGTQFFMDNNKWKHVLLWQLEILEDLI